MGLFRRKRTIVAQHHVGSAAVPIVERFEDLPPVHIDRQRLDKALGGERTIIPNGLSAEEISRFIDHAAKDVK